MSRVFFKHLVVGLFLTSIVSQGLGCATYVALKQPGPVPDEGIYLGMHRSDVAGNLGVIGSSYDEPADFVRVRYKYLDGAHEASKGRVVLYLAGDVFTLFLTEIIFWPIELAVASDYQRTAEALFDPDNRLTHFRSMKTGNRKLLLDLWEGDYPLLPNAIRPPTRP